MDQSGHPNVEKASFIVSFNHRLHRWISLRNLWMVFLQGVNSYAPISIAPKTGRAVAVPTANATCNGGTNTGGNNGLMNGCPAGLAGAPFPALTSGLVEMGRTSKVLMFVNPGLVPNKVPVHAVGTNAEPVGIQLFVPVLTRPETQRTRVSKTI